jgi:hypothetical protein
MSVILPSAPCHVTRLGSRITNDGWTVAESRRVAAVRLDGADAAELAELLQFLSDWLSADRDRLEASLRQFLDTGGYDVTQLRNDLARFVFLLGGDDGDALFTDTGPVDQP